MAVHDVTVVGGGPGGLACAATAARYGLSVVLYEGTALGGQLNTLTEIYDLPGLACGSGPDLAAALMDNALQAGVRVEYAQVSRLTPAGGGWRVADDGGRARNVVVATGSEPDLAAIPGAAEALGRGVSTCASCDGPLFRDKDVAVIGGGRDAMVEAAELSRYASSVTLLEVGSRPEATPTVPFPQAERVTRVEVDAVPVVVGAPVQAVRLRARGGDQRVEVAGVFPACGRLPVTTVIGGSPAGIKVGPDLCSERGFYAIGDARLATSWTVIGAIGDGVAVARHLAMKTKRGK